MKIFNRDNLSDRSDITQVWNISSKDLEKISETMISLENKLDQQYKGHYFDYQLVDDFFQGLSDAEKAMIFVYGQLVHDRIYKKNL